LWYGVSEMKPMGEFYNLESDPLEMKNLAEDIESVDVLYSLRAKYNTEFEKWVKEAVSYNNFQQYGTLLDSIIPWEKKGLLKKK
jgi:hypothetical protein